MIEHVCTYDEALEKFDKEQIQVASMAFLKLSLKAVANALDALDLPSFSLLTANGENIVAKVGNRIFSIVPYFDSRDGSFRAFKLDDNFYTGGSLKEIVLTIIESLNRLNKV